MTVPTQASYKHFLYPTSSGSPKLMASTSLLPSQDYAAEVVQSNAGHPVDVVFQHEAAVYDGVGAVDLGDMLFAFANFLPHSYMDMDTELGIDRKFTFPWEDAATRAGYTDPLKYARMLMYSDTYQCYQMDAPTLESMRVELRRQGESRLLTRWLTQDVKKVATPATEPAPDPPAEVKVIGNSDWQVSYSTDTLGWESLSGVIRATLDVPRFREGVYTFEGGSSSWSDIAQIRSAPMVTLDMLTNANFADNVFGQANELYIELGGGTDFRLRCHAKKSDQRLFKLDNDNLIASVDMTLVGIWAPNEPTEFTAKILGSATTPTGPDPTATTFSVGAAEAYKFAAGDIVYMQETTKEVASIDATGLITLKEALGYAPSPGNEVTRLPAWPRNRYAEIIIGNTPHTGIA